MVFRRRAKKGPYGEDMAGYWKEVDEVEKKVRKWERKNAKKLSV